MPPGQSQQCRTGRLHRRLLDQPADGRLVEPEATLTVGGQHLALLVSRRAGAEQLVVHVSVEHRDDQQVGGERQRVDTDPDSGQPQAALGARRLHAAGERPASVVDRLCGRGGDFWRPRHLLGVLPQQPKP